MIKSYLRRCLLKTGRFAVLASTILCLQNSYAGVALLGVSVYDNPVVAKKLAISGGAVLSVAAVLYGGFIATEVVAILVAAAPSSVAAFSGMAAIVVAPIGVILLNEDGTVNNMSYEPLNDEAIKSLNLTKVEVDEYNKNVPLFNSIFFEIINTNSDDTSAIEYAKIWNHNFDYFGVSQGARKVFAIINRNFLAAAQ